MRLIPNWRDVLRHAWSVRLLILAAVFSGAEAALPLLEGTIPISLRAFAVLTFLVVVAALILRIVAQKELRNGKSD